MKWMMLTASLLGSVAAMADQAKTTLIVCPRSDDAVWIKDTGTEDAFFSVVPKSGARVGGKVEAVSEGVSADQNEYVLEFRSLDSLSRFRIAIPDLNGRAVGTFRGKGQLHIELGGEKLDIPGTPCLIKMK